MKNIQAKILRHDGFVRELCQLCSPSGHHFPGGKRNAVETSVQLQSGKGFQIQEESQERPKSSLPSFHRFTGQALSSLTQCFPLYITVTMSFRLLAKPAVSLPCTAHLKSLFPCLQSISEVHGEHQLKERISDERWCIWWDTRVAAKWQKELNTY